MGSDVTTGVTSGPLLLKRRKYSPSAIGFVHRDDIRRNHSAFLRELPDEGYVLAGIH